MSNRAIVILVVVAAAASFAHEHLAKYGRDRGPAVVEEIRRPLRLEPGASVEVSSVGSRITVERSDSSAAEIRVVRRASCRDDLQRHRLRIDGSASHLVVRAESPAPPCWVLSDEMSQEVTLFVPESVSVSTHTLGEVITFG